MPERWVMKLRMTRFRLEHGYGRSRDAGHLGHGRHVRAFPCRSLPAKGDVQGLEHRADNGQAYHQSVLFGADGGVHPRFRREEPQGRQLRPVLNQGQINAFLQQPFPFGRKKSGPGREHCACPHFMRVLNEKRPRASAAPAPEPGTRHEGVRNRGAPNGRTAGPGALK